MQLNKNLGIASVALAAGARAALDTVYLNNTDLPIQELLSTQVSYANSSLFVGRAFLQESSEAYLVPTTGGTYFTSYHSVATGGMSFYIYANETRPVGFTIPHSSSVPLGASTAELDFTGPGEVLAFNGVNKFYGCQVTAADVAADAYNIYWAGDGLPGIGKCLAGPLEIIRRTQCAMI